MADRGGAQARVRQTCGLWLAVLILLFTGPAATRLFAHAVLVHAQPTSGAILSQPPQQIRLEFSEPVEAEFNGIAVYNSEGMRVDSGKAASDPADIKSVQLALGQLPYGAYTVVWHVVSADGHPVEGAFGFLLGTSTASAQVKLPRAPAWKKFVVPAAGLVHAIAILGLLLLAGIPLLYLFVYRPVRVGFTGTDIHGALSEEAIQAVLYGTLRLAVWLAIVFSLFSLLVEAVRVVGQAPSLPVLYRLASHTRFGHVWSVRMLGLFVIAGFSFWLRRDRLRGLSSRALWLSATFAALLLATPGLAGHPGAASGRKAIFLLSADWLHLLAAAPWVAGLWIFAFGLRKLFSGMTQSNRARLAIALIDRFARIAIVSVALLVVSGVFGAIEHVPSVSGLFSTSYGQTLLSKTVLLLPVLALAGTHHRWFKPQAERLIRAGDGQQMPEVVNRFRIMVCIEFALVGAILVAAGLLVNLPPVEASLATQRGQTFEESRLAGGFQFRVRIRPARVGLNSAELEISSPEQGPHVDQLHPSLTARMLAHDMGIQEPSLKRISPTQFLAQDLMLGMSGPWEVNVRAALLDGEQVETSFRLYVPPPEEKH